MNPEHAQNRDPKRRIIALQKTGRRRGHKIPSRKSRKAKKRRSPIGIRSGTPEKWQTDEKRRKILRDGQTRRHDSGRNATLRGFPHPFSPACRFRQSRPGGREGAPTPGGARDKRLRKRPEKGIVTARNPETFKPAKAGWKINGGRHWARTSDPQLVELVL